MSLPAPCARRCRSIRHGSPGPAAQNGLAPAVEVTELPALLEERVQFPWLDAAYTAVRLVVEDDERGRTLAEGRRECVEELGRVCAEHDLVGGAALDEPFAHDVLPSEIGRASCRE